MAKVQKSNKTDVLIVLSVILFVIAIIMALLSTSKLLAKKTELLTYSEKSDILYEIIKKDEHNDNNIINIDFNYNFYANEKINLDYNYTLTSTVTVTSKKTGKNLFYDEEILVPLKKIGLLDTAIYNIQEPLNIDYDKYNEIVKDKMENKDLSNIKAFLTITLKVNTSSDDFMEKLETNRNSSIEIPLLQEDIKFLKNEVDETNKLLGIKDEIIKNKKLFILAIVMTSLAAIILIIAFVLFLIEPNIKNSYNKEYKKVAKMIRDYDELIERTYQMPSLKDKKIIEVPNIDDFIALRDKYELTITMIEQEELITFIMVDNNKVWKYIIEIKLTKKV